MKARATGASPTTSRPAQQPVRKADLEQFFAGVSSRMDGDDMPLAASEVKRFLAAVSHKVESAEQQQRSTDQRWATGFNVFDLIEPDENRLSDILAQLLDPKGAHGQGNLFLRLLFKQIGLGAGVTRTKNAKVQREAPTYGILRYRRRIDVLVEAGVVLAIENKVDSAEQADQVKDYLEHLHPCPTGGVLIYLTPDRRCPDSVGEVALAKHQKCGTLHCWSYPREIRHWLEACRKQCKALRICDFRGDFIAYIDIALVRAITSHQEEAIGEE